MESSKEQSRKEYRKEMTQDRKSMLNGIFHLAISKQYLESFRASCRETAKNQAQSWINKLSFTQRDIYSALTKESREHFEREIHQCDLIQYEYVFETLLKLDPKQRDKLESYVEELINEQEQNQS